MLQLHKGETSYEFDGGVYAYPLRNSRRNAVVGVRFCQLPSPNLGLEFKEWRIHNLGLSAQGFAIDTTQDLLVPFELTNPTRSWSEGCRIYFRTMSENS